MSKTIRVMLEVPEDWVDVDSPAIWFAPQIRIDYERKLEKAVNEVLSKGLKLPKTREIDAEEVRYRMIQILAERALEKV